MNSREHGNPHRYTALPTQPRFCRCPECTEAHRAYVAARRKRALELGALSHGRRGTYDAGCRCLKCRNARQVAYYTVDRDPDASIRFHPLADTG